ncbi:MAG: ribonuclease HII [Gammaproteobacteria bacterium]|nr:ribonuclease HII [Gammaproteobacteria bacterium]
MWDALPVVTGLLAGTDEAGRGPLVGNVVAAAVILGADHGILGLADSKKLTAKRREELAGEIKQHALAWAVVSVSPAEIDRINILQASLLAMKLSVEQLQISPDHVFVDGNHAPVLSCPVTPIIKGDARVAEISAASILAKVERDAQMQVLHMEYPHYGFDRHKGYPTKAHMATLAEHGPCPEHRRSYAPVRRCLVGKV